MKPLIQRHTLSENVGGYILEEIISHYKSRVYGKIKYFKTQAPDQVGFVVPEKQTSELLIKHQQLDNNIPEFENEALANYYAEGLKLFVKQKDT